MNGIEIPFMFDTGHKKQYTIEDIRAIIREISDNFYGDILNANTVQRLNATLDRLVNIPCNLSIYAKFTPNSLSTVTLFGNDERSKLILDPNYKSRKILNPILPGVKHADD